MNCWTCYFAAKEMEESDTITLVVPKIPEAIGICVFCGKGCCEDHADIFGGQQMIMCPQCKERRES